jgi:hypothetical protein
MGWNCLPILQNVLGHQQGYHVDILHSNVTRDQYNHSVKNKPISVPSKGKIIDGTGELQTYHCPQPRLRASGAYFGESYATNSVDSDVTR